MAYPNLETPLSQSPLMQMLVNMQRQGAIERAQVGPTLGQGISEMLHGFQRQGEIGRQREFQLDMNARENLQRQQAMETEARLRSDLETTVRQPFERRMAQDVRSVEGARRRREMAEDTRRFNVEQKRIGESQMLERLAAMERIAQEYAASGQAIPPGLSDQINALRARVAGVGGPGPASAPPPAVAPPAVAPVPSGGFKGAPATLAEAKARRESLAAMEAEKNRGVAEGVRELAPYIGKPQGLTNRERAADETRINQMASTLATAMVEEGDLLRQTKGGPVAKTPAGRILRAIAASMVDHPEYGDSRSAKGTLDEDQILARLGGYSNQKDIKAAGLTEDQMRAYIRYLKANYFGATNGG